MKKYIALPVVMLCSLALMAQEPTPVNIASTQRITINSAITGQVYDLLIHLPGNYNSQTQKTLYTLFTETSLFNRYFLTSPALNWGNGILWQHESNFARRNSGLPVKLFMAHGDLELPATFLRFVDTLKKRNYAGLELQTRILENTGHSGTKSEGYSRGLQWVFARPSLKLPPTVLNNYAGTYLAGADTLKVVGESDRLTLIAPGNYRFPLDAATENEFYLKGQFFNLQFRKDEAGNISGFRLERFGGESFAKKISK